MVLGFQTWIQCLTLPQVSFVRLGKSTCVFVLLTSQSLKGSCGTKYIPNYKVLGYYPRNYKIKELG